VKIKINKIVCFIIVVSFLLSTSATAIKITKKSENFFLKSSNDDKISDYCPNGDLKITFTLKEIRSLDTIDFLSNPDFYVKVFINGVEKTSKVWNNQNYVKEEWSTTVDIPEDLEEVEIKIQLWDKNYGLDRLCDLDNDYDLYPENRDIELVYYTKTGHWRGDDAIQRYLDWDSRGDPSGYGRLNGCDDNSIYQNDLDCELSFDISQTDPDGDGIPWWTEVYEFKTDPEIDNSGEDEDLDGLPIEWEYNWGLTYYQPRRDSKWEELWIYHPLIWNNHSNLDPDNDGLDNIEEYKAFLEGFPTDPFRQDILLEIDQMKDGPNGEGSLLPGLTDDLLRDSYGKHNIVFIVDNQGKVIEFDKNTSGWKGPELQQIYYKYFLDENISNWRRGVFHYAPIIYNSDDYVGFMWNSVVGNWNGNWDDPNLQNCSIRGDCFQLSTNELDVRQYQWPLYYKIAQKSFNKEKQRAIVYATVIMHETGHVLGIYNSNVPGCDNRTGMHPWQINWWIWRNYKSCMNYGYMYTFVDYSDGSNGKNDFDDWNNIDLTLFQIEKNPNYQKK